jgi:hypothetical protein
MPSQTFPCVPFPIPGPTHIPPRKLLSFAASWGASRSWNRTTRIERRVFLAVVTFPHPRDRLTRTSARSAVRTLKSPTHASASK